MQHVKKSWLSVYAYTLLGVDVLLIGFYVWINQPTHDTSSYAHWGITPLILGLALVHALYIAIVFPLVRRKSEWFGSFVSAVIFIILMAALIETSQYNNLVIRFAYVLFVFSLSLIGPFVFTATVVATWVMLLYTYISVLARPESISMSFEAAIDILVTIAGILGWLIFRRFYVEKKSQETIALSKLLEQEQFKASVMLESVSDGVIVIGTNGTIQVLNESAAIMLGWTKADALRLNYLSLLKPLDHNRRNHNSQNATELIQKVFDSHRSQQEVVLLQTKNGRQFYADIVASPIMETPESKDQEPKTIEKHLVGVIAILRDVDEQKRQEQQRSDFISTASHEMRTPVALIEGFVDLALNPKAATTDERARAYLTKAREATLQLGRLFQDLLTVSQSEEGKILSKAETVEVGKVLRELFVVNKERAQEKNLELLFAGSASGNIEPALCVNADPERLREVIQNLVDNAIKYTASGKVTLSAETADQSVLITISDTGAGIASEDIPHLFQKFYRTDNSATREVGGTGLGLYICKQVVEVMGGEIWVESELGQGSSFYIKLPRVDQA